MSGHVQSGGKWVSSRVLNKQHQEPATLTNSSSGVKSGKFVEDSVIASLQAKERESLSPLDDEETSTVNFEFQTASDALSNLSHTSDECAEYKLLSVKSMIQSYREQQNFHKEIMKAVENLKT